MDADFKEQIKSEGVKDENIDILDNPSYENLIRFVIGYADGVVLSSEQIDPAIIKIVRESSCKVLEWQDAQEQDFYENYDKFYESL